MSLRIKFLGILVVIPSFCLVVFLYFATTTFATDKKSTLYETQISLLNSAILYVEGGDVLNTVTGMDSGSTLIAKLDNLKKQEGFEKLLVSTAQGKIWPETKETRDSLEEKTGKDVFQKLLAQTTSEGSFEAGGFLVSFIKFQPKAAPSLIFILASKAELINRASLLFVLKALATFIALISLSVIISILFSNRLTSGIKMLSEAMVNFGKGDFKSPLPSLDSQDEVAKMANQFGVMRKQISSLILEKEAKVKIETEMALAGTLQRSFFPEYNFKNDTIEFSGYFQSAAQAGGDWWFYFTSGQWFVCLIGDVTGHGLNSAMVTGIARSVLSLVAKSYTSNSDLLEKLNTAIFETTRGNLMMTCTVCAINMETGEAKLTNAAHEGPVILPAKSGTISRREFKFPITSAGTRLGEKNSPSYETVSFHLEKNESVFFFSDGLIDLQDPNRNSFGERNLFKNLGLAHAASLSAIEIKSKIENAVLRFKADAQLVDDLSFFVVKRV